MIFNLGLNLYRAHQLARARVGWPRTGDLSRLGHALSIVLTFHFVCIGRVPFVCDVDKAWVIIPRLLRLQ